MDFKNLLVTTYHPHGFGPVERFQRKILNALRGYVANISGEWDFYMDAITYVYNTQVTRITLLSSFEHVLSERSPPVPIEAQITLSEVLSPSSYWDVWKIGLLTMYGLLGKLWKNLKPRTNVILTLVGGYLSLR